MPVGVGRHTVGERPADVDTEYVLHRHLSHAPGWTQRISSRAHSVP
jgi:hypothetical protein